MPVKASLEKAKPKATPEVTGAPDATDAPKTADAPEASTDSSSVTSSETDGKPAEPTKMPTADINPAA